MTRAARPILILAALAASSACAMAQGAPAGPTAAPADAKLYIIAPPDGARLRGPFVVQFGLRNMGVTQAGVRTPNTGHHHILVDEKDPVSPDETIPADKNHIHFGGGQTETRLDLAPGTHTLQLVLGDADHKPFRPMIASEKITVTVLGPKPARRARKRSRYYY